MLTIPVWLLELAGTPNPPADVSALATPVVARPTYASVLGVSSAPRTENDSSELPLLTQSIAMNDTAGAALASDVESNGGWTPVTRSDLSASDSESKSTVAKAASEMSIQELDALVRRHEAISENIEFDKKGNVPSTENNTLGTEDRPQSTPGFAPKPHRVTVEEVEDEDDLISFNHVASNMSKPVVGPSQDKGKGADPGNWGDVSVLQNFSATDLEAQREMFKNYEEINRVLSTQITVPVSMPLPHRRPFRMRPKTCAPFTRSCTPAQVPAAMPILSCLALPRFWAHILSGPDAAPVPPHAGRLLWLSSARASRPVHSQFPGLSVSPHRDHTPSYGRMHNPLHVVGNIVKLHNLTTATLYLSAASHLPHTTCAGVRIQCPLATALPTPRLKECYVPRTPLRTTSPPYALAHDARVSAYTSCVLPPTARASSVPPTAIPHVAQLVFADVGHLPAPRVWTVSRAMLWGILLCLFHLSLRAADDLAGGASARTWAQGSQRDVEAHSYAVIADGHKWHNMAKVYATFYASNDATVERSKQQRVPVVLVAKCGNPHEAGEAYDLFYHCKI
ncbi:chitin synthase-domain-containing protein [Mycena olivaceomarginata]|nr:chitin synthase-domain-containing protein [Mycena olivaceomarginata]